MAITTQGQGGVTPHKIYATLPGQKLRPEALMDIIQDLLKRGSFTDRDERVLEYLRELYVLSLDHLQRLLWPDARRVTTYQRMYHLHKHHLLDAARVPRAAMKAWGLDVCKVYCLGPGGRLWLKEELDGVSAAFLRRDRVLHDLLVAEVMVRMVEAIRRRGESWSFTWAGEQAAGAYGRHNGDPPAVQPDGLAVIRQARDGQSAAMPFFVEMDASREAHGRPSSQWGRKIVGYDRFVKENWKAHPELSGLPDFPIVAVVTHGDARLLNLAAAIQEHRKGPVAYYLALWEDLVPQRDTDALSAPAWLVITPDGETIGEDRARRQPMINEPRRKRRGK